MKNYLLKTFQYFWAFQVWDSFLVMIEEYLVGQKNFFISLPQYYFQIFLDFVSHLFGQNSFLNFQIGINLKLVDQSGPFFFDVSISPGSFMCQDFLKFIIFKLPHYYYFVIFKVQLALQLVVWDGLYFWDLEFRLPFEYLSYKDKDCSL